MSVAELISGVNYFPPPPGLVSWPHVSKWSFDLHWRRWLTLQGWTDSRIEQYRIDREYHGIGYQHFAGKGRNRKPSGPMYWIYLPTPKQVEAHSCPLPNLLYGGAAGGAKSHFLRYDLYRRCWYYPGYRSIIFRREQKELYEHHLDLAKRESQLWGKAAMGFEVVGEEIRFANTSLIRLGYATHPGDEIRYLSIEYDCIDIDELATFEQSQFAEIQARCRTTKEGVMAMLRCSSNPAGAHTLWVVDRFITKTISPDEDPFYNPAEFGFIQARLYDNPYYMDPDGTFRTYEKRLGPLPKTRRQQLLDGDWTAISGQFFEEFKNAPGDPTSHVQRVAVPRGTKYFRSMDWGYSKPGVCYWIACLPDGHLHVHQEYKFEKTLVAKVGQRIRQMTSELGAEVPGGVHCAYTVVDPAMDAHTGAAGESMLETLNRRADRGGGGVPAYGGDNERVLGWQRLRAWLALAPDGRPWLTVDPRCSYFIRTFPALVGDKHNPEDVDTRGDDHAGDSIRYGVMSRPTPTRMDTGRKYPPGSVGWLRQYAKRLERKRAS